MGSMTVKQFVSSLLTTERRKKFALRLLGSKFYVMKREKLRRAEYSFPDIVAMPAEQRPIQSILATLPHVQPEYLLSEWFWSEKYYPVYNAVASLLRPESVLEIGSLQGFSLISLLNGSPHITHAVWIDNEAYVPSSNQMCYENVQFFYRHFHSQRKVPALQFFSNTFDALRLLDGPKIDLIHIDGEHTYDGKLRDLTVCGMLKPRYILLDDYANTGNHRAIEYWAEQLGLDYAVIDTTDRGLAFFDLTTKKTALNLLKKHHIPIVKEFRRQKKGRQ